MLSFFPRGVLDEILNLIESVSEGFSSYSCILTTDTVVYDHYLVKRYQKLKSHYVLNLRKPSNKNIVPPKILTTNVIPNAIFLLSAGMHPNNLYKFKIIYN